MDNFNTDSPKSAWKGRLIKFLIYVVVGFLCAFLYGKIKH